MFVKVLYLRLNCYIFFKLLIDDCFDIDLCLFFKYRKFKCEFGVDILYNYEMKFVFLLFIDVNLYFCIYEINFFIYENLLYLYIVVVVIVYIYVYLNKIFLRFMEDNFWCFDND